MSDLTDALKQLAHWRRQLADEKNKSDQCQALLRATPEWQRLAESLVLVASAVGVVADLEDKVRGLALKDFEWVGNRKPAPGIEVKLYSKWDYEPKVAEQWVRKNAPYLLRFDARAFETAAAVLTSAGVPATEIKEPRANIAKDLSEYAQGEAQTEVQP